MDAAPDASSKLRLVLDYLPCEACLAQPVRDQDLLCSICHRLHRQVAVKATTRTTVILERPSLPVAAPVVIPAAVPEPEPTPLAAQLEPAPAPAPVPAPLPELIVETEPLVVPEPEYDMEPAVAMPVEAQDEPSFDDDLTSFEPPSDSFELVPAEPAPEPAREEAVVLSESIPEDDYVFRPPEEEPVFVAPEPAPEPPEDMLPTEEIPLEPEAPAEPSPWAPPEEILAEPEPAPVEETTPEPIPEALTVEEEIVEMEVLPDEEPAPEPAAPPVYDAEVLEEEVVEMEVLPDDEPSDLARLKGHQPEHEAALRKVGVDSIASLAGHDANELSARSGVPASLLVPWIQVADLVHEVGVPIDSAIALVSAGIAGPRALRDMAEDDILDRVEAFGGVRLSGRDVKRWKRRV